MELIFYLYLNCYTIASKQFEKCLIMHKLYGNYYYGVFLRVSKVIGETCGKDIPHEEPKETLLFSLHCTVHAI